APCNVLSVESAKIRTSREVWSSSLSNIRAFNLSLNPHPCYSPSEPVVSPVVRLVVSPIPITPITLCSVLQANLLLYPALLCLGWQPLYVSRKELGWATTTTV